MRVWRWLFHFIEKKRSSAEQSFNCDGAASIEKKRNVAETTEQQLSTMTAALLPLEVGNKKKQKACFLNKTGIRRLFFAHVFQKTETTDKGNSNQDKILIDISSHEKKSFRHC